MKKGSARTKPKKPKKKTAGDGGYTVEMNCVAYRAPTLADFCEKYSGLKTKWK